MSGKHSRLKPLLRLFLFFILALPLAPPLGADYQDGLDAYSRGDYRRALREWKTVTAQPASQVNPAIYAEAHYAVARLYWDGQGVLRDYAVAREWLEKAAALDHAGAMAKLGFLYTDGLSVEQDFAQAFEWFQAAARRGDVDGLYNLGIFYLNGWGTAPDPVMARQYLATASALGDPAAEQALQQLLATTTEDSPVDESSEGGSSVAGGDAFSRGEFAAEAAPTKESLAGAASAANTSGNIESQVSSAPRQEPWILAQNPNHYTIQAIGLRSRKTLEDLLDGHEDLAPFAIYVVQRTTDPLYVLVQGVYHTVEEARAARDAFPRGINRPDRVWIRQFDKVQQVIKTEQARED